MRPNTSILLFLLSSSPSSLIAWSPSSPSLLSSRPKLQIGGITSSQSPLFRRGPLDSATATTSTAEDPNSPSSLVTTHDVDVELTKKKHHDRLAKIRSEGGPLSFQTKYGALNPYSIFYGLTSILLGLIWYVEISTCRLLFFLTRNRFDRKRRVPIFFSQLWGETLMLLTRSFPTIENYEILKEFYKTKRAAMFVANHNSWQDIPYLGYTIGWRNYKLVAKKELEKVPILSAAIKAGGNVIVDRTDRRSQLLTLKSGIQWLKDGVHLCTFPEGTRSRSGRLMNFKNGAFKMAFKVGAPVIPISIVGSGNVMPTHWLFPNKTPKKVAKVVIHEPIESEGKTEAELAQAVREAIISGLPEDQRPLEKEDE